MNNVSTFLAELAALMEKYEIDSIDGERLYLWPIPARYGNSISLGDELTPELLFELSKELDK